jgi:hypothetical protein
MSFQNGMKILSLLLCMAATLFWLWPERYYHWVQISGGPTPYSLRASSDGIRCSYQDSDVIVIVFRLPWWLICLVTSIAPAVWWLKHKRRKREFPGHCPNCNYDLRATPDGCPECRQVIKQC